jgi:hypothetical protein
LFNIRYYEPVAMAILIVSSLKNIEPTVMSEKKRQESMCLLNVGVKCLSIASQNIIG